MRIIIIHTEGEVFSAEQLLGLFEKMDLFAETFPVGSTEDSGQFMAFLDPYGSGHKGGVLLGAPTHAIILSSLAPRWFDFLAGFACGSHLPLLVYGEEAVKGIPEGFTSCFKVIGTEDELRKYFDDEREEYEKREAVIGVNKAREALLQMGIPVNDESMSNCAGNGNIWEISLFLAAGFSPDTRNKAGVPLLNVAARKGNREVLRYLILVGAELNLIAADRGTSALLDSVMGKHHELAEELIKAGADLNVTSKDGQTALVVAVGAGDEKMVEALLKAGADPDIADHMGVSAKKYAALFKKSTIMTLFDTYAPEKTG